MALLAHASAYQLYNTKYRATQKGKVGLVLGITDYRPATTSAADVAAAARAMAWSAGVYMEPIFGSGNWPALMISGTAAIYAKVNQPNPLPVFTAAEQQLIKGETDVPVVVA